ncbi:hypothetical protein ACOAJ8_00945 [Arcobacter cryaerophilus gv. pseudocryaerophilus]
MPFLLPLATLITGVLTVKTVNKTIKTYERRKKEMKEIKFDLELQKEVAKIGMSATLGATVVTSMFMKNKIAKNTHIIAGVAFCGFALWHHMLYQPKKSKKENEKNIINPTKSSIK